MVKLALLPLIGVVVGAYGTLVGAGGGFVLAPILLLMYPRDSSSTIASISLAVVFFNALSGSWAYARQKRIDYQTGRRFAIATVPGAILGALTTGFLSRGTFDLTMGALLIFMAVFLFLRPEPRANPRPTWQGLTTRTLTNAAGDTYMYAFDQRLGLILSFGVGFVSSVLGIGGGIIHVPALIQLLNFPPHVATATSHFILAITAFTGTSVHIATGQYSQGWRRTLLLSVGVIVGAQLGARLSTKMGGSRILRLLALALALVGVRLILKALGWF